MIAGIVYAVLGAAFGWLMRCVLDRMPARCFCDYDENPGQEHDPPRMTKRQQIICGVLLFAVSGYLGLRFGFTLESAGLLLLSCVLMMIAVCDVRYRIIPDELVIAAAVAAIVSALPQFFTGYGFWERSSPILGAIIGAAVILVMNLAGRVIYKKDTMGMGDLKLMAVVGLACGTVGVVIVLLVGLMAAALWFVGAIVLKKAKSEDFLPLGPFLVFGAMFTSTLRPLIDVLIGWYVSLI